MRQYWQAFNQTFVTLFITDLTFQLTMHGISVEEEGKQITVIRALDTVYNKCIFTTVKKKKKKIVCVLNHNLLYMYVQEMWKNTVAYDKREF